MYTIVFAFCSKTSGQGDNLLFVFVQWVIMQQRGLVTQT